MAGASVGSLNVDLTIGTARFKKGIGEAQSSIDKMQKRFDAVGSRMQGIGLGLTAGLTAPLIALGVKSVQAANESKAALAQVESALASMGAASGRTSTQLQELAGRLQDTSLFDDDDILAKSTANLLTFGRINGQVFDQAQQAIVDYAARTGADLQGATIMIGKALNDPLKGLTALSKVGVQFTADQKAMITSMVAAGNTAGAQKLILAELESQYKGAAQAARDAAPGADTDQQWRTFQETIGEIVNRVLPPLTALLTSALGAFNSLSPAMQSTVVTGAAVAAALGPLTGTIGLLASGVGAALPLLVKMGPALTAMRLAGLAALPALLPIIAPLAAIAGGIALVVVAVRNWDTIKAYADRVVTFMASLYTGVKTWLGDKLVSVIAAVSDKVRGLTEPFRYLWDKVVGHSYVPDLVDGISRHFARLDGEMVKPATEAAAKTEQAFQALRDKVGPVLDRLFPDQAKLRQYREEMAALIELAGKEGWSRESTDRAIGALRAENPDAIFPAAVDNSTDAIRAPNIGSPVSAGATDQDRDSIAGALDRAAASVNDRMTALRSVFDQLAQTGTGCFSDIAGIIADQVIPALDGAGEGVGTLQNKLTVLADVLGSVFGAIFGKKAGRIIGQVANAGLAIAQSFGGFKAGGGPVTGGKAYVVGEEGPEIFTPDRSGLITSNRKSFQVPAAAGEDRVLLLAA